MPNAIVDTNAPIVANGDNEMVCFECRFKTVEFLENLMNSGHLIVDLQGEVEVEYWNNLKSGYPGVGNRFLQHFFTARADRVERVNLVKDAAGNYENIPFKGALKNFDKSDRKFASLSVATGVAVTVSVDTDWAISKDALEAAGVKIEFLCGENATEWFM